MKLSSAGEIDVQSERSFQMACPRAVEGNQVCTCRVASECLECDPFEIATDAQHEGEVDEGWCASTGHKQLLECEYGTDESATAGNTATASTVGTYRSCSPIADDRHTFVIFLALCFVLGLGTMVGVRKRQVALYKQIERRLQDQIDSA